LGVSCLYEKVNKEADKVIQLGYYVLRIYRNDKFIGYVKTYRKQRNAKYRFEKTRNINNACQIFLKVNCEHARDNLTFLRDKIYDNEVYRFEVVKTTEQELRKSKLHLLNVAKDFKKRGVI
jgi:hypothetical protein